MPYLILEWGKGRYYPLDLLPAPEKSPRLAYLFFIVIQRGETGAVAVPALEGKA